MQQTFSAHVILRLWQSRNLSIQTIFSMVGIIFVLADERNDRLKEPIRKRFVEYLDRAEKLKEFLNKSEEKKQKIGANGSEKSTGGKGGK